MILIEVRELRKYTTLIFDLDDTLFDFKACEKNGLKNVFAHYGLQYNEETFGEYELVNQMIWREIEQGTANKSEILNQRFRLFFQKYQIEVDGSEAESMYRKYLDQGYHLMPAADSCLKELKENGFRIFAGTNGFGSTQRARLKGAHLEHFFEDTFISEEIGYEKPDKRFFNAVFAQIPDFNSDDTLMIGDRLSSDIVGGNQAGIDTCWFNPNKLDLIQSQAQKPTYIMTSLNDLAEELIAAWQISQTAEQKGR